VVVAGTDAAAVVLPHLARQLISLHAQRADVAAQVETPWRVAHPHVPGPDHTCPGSGVPAAAVLAGPDPGQGPPVTGAQLASYAGLAPVTRRSGSSIRGEHVSHGGSKRLKRAMLPSAVASLRSAPPPLGPTTSANATKTKRFRPGRPRPGPPPHPDPARHDPQRHPLQPTTINTTTRSRLTHHTGHVASRTPPRSASNASSAPSNPSRTSPSTSTDTTSSRSPDPRSRRHPHHPQHPNRALKLCN